MNLPLDGLNPCDLVTDELRQRFSVDRPVAPPDYAEPARPLCSLLSTTVGGYVISLHTDEGMERFEGIPEQLGTVRQLTVAGFPAAELRDTAQPDACLIGIDVADGQHLGVDVQSDRKPRPLDEICREAAELAEIVLGNLRQQLGR